MDTGEFHTEGNEFQTHFPSGVDCNHPAWECYLIAPCTSTHSSPCLMGALPLCSPWLPSLLPGDSQTLIHLTSGLGIILFKNIPGNYSVQLRLRGNLCVFSVVLPAEGSTGQIALSLHNQWWVFLVWRTLVEPKAYILLASLWTILYFSSYSFG